MKQLILLIAMFGLAAHEGKVRFGELPVPGASIKATRSDKTLHAVTDADGTYSFPEWTAGTWTFEVTMPGFETLRREVTLSPETPAAEFNLKMLALSELKTASAPPGFSSSPSTPALQTASPSEPEAADRLLINGTVNNGASTPFALPRGIGNNRPGIRSLYTGAINISGNNSLLDARSFSLTGQDTPKPDYNRLQTTITAGGPLQIPSLFRNGMFTAGYSRTQNRNANLQTVQVPTAAERRGDFSASANPFVIPESKISPQAKALAALYPLPNFDGHARYNYQIATVGVTHADNVQAAVNNIVITSGDRLSGNVSFQSTRSDNPDLFGFTDATNSSSASLGLTWNRRVTQRTTGVIRFQFNRSVAETSPYFGGRVDVSGDAGITGNDRDPRNWGPPSLNFAGGIARLGTGSYAFDRAQSATVGYSSNWNRSRHAISYGVDYRRQQFNLFSQRDARGTFTFTGAATGNDFADFLLGVPTASSIAFGNADKYFRQSFYNAFINNDWRIRASISVTLGVRWEYESPITERYGRLVNLDVASGFRSASPVIAGTSDNSLVRPDKSGFQPRIGLAWRPRVASSMVVRAAYGVYRDTTVYRAIADQMAQQSPLSKSLSVQNSPSHPITLADGFRGSPSVSATTFAIDPRFRVGNARNWQVSLQQDLPQAMQMTVTYLGIKGTHVPQRILPNTFPSGAADACLSCPAGFIYLTSNGNSNKHAGTVEVRRRQRNGFQASAQYTFSKAIDDAGIGSAGHIAQNWLDLRSERGLSNFDQRHQFVAQTQYTAGMLAGVGTFWDGWRGKLLKEWTFTSQLTLGSGSPLTPVILAPVSGTGMTGTLRPHRTASEEFIAPGPGEWGNAARNSITGPRQFALNASLARTFRVNDRVSMDLRVDATNVLNHVTFPRFNTIVNSAQFGFPVNANPMRTLQPSLRVRFQ